MEYSTPLSALHLTALLSRVFPPLVICWALADVRQPIALGGGTTSSKDSPDRDAVPGLQITICFPYTGRGKGGQGRGLDFVILIAENGLYSLSLKQSPQPRVAPSGSPGHPMGSSEELSVGAPYGAPPCQLKPSTGTTGHYCRHRLLLQAGTS